MTIDELKARWPTYLHGVLGLHVGLKPKPARTKQTPAERRAKQLEGMRRYRAEQRLKKLEETPRESWCQYYWKVKRKYSHRIWWRWRNSKRSKMEFTTEV